ncbi:MAG: queuosine precursor transporter [Paludibacteraceae bacterium]
MKKQVSVAFMASGLVFATCLIVSNIVEQKLINIGPVEATAGLLIFPISYIINDIIAEVWGYKKARLIIWLGFLMNFFAVAVFKLSIEVSGSANFGHQEAFALVLGSNTARITAASFVAFLLGAFTNAFVMSKMKILQKGRNFSLRAVVSTLFGEGIDSVIFFNIAFYGIIPTDIIFELIMTQTLMKTGYEIVVLPLTNYIVRKVKRIEGVDVYDKNISYNPLKIKDI